MRNRINGYLLPVAILAIFALGACEVTSRDVSSVTFFPEITLNGDKYVSIVLGNEFDDPGAVATEQGEEIAVETSGSVDATTPGVYAIIYSATNQDGFAGSETRYVAVIPENEVPGTDLSGLYDNVGSFNYTAVIEKLAEGFYRTDNCWGGGSAAIIPAFFFCLDGTNITLPESEISPYGPVLGNGTIDEAGLIVWEITLPAFGITQVKQWQRQ